MTEATQTHDRLLELARDSRLCMLTTTGTDGQLCSRPMTVQRIDDDATVWFIASRDSRKAEQLRANAAALVTTTGDGSWTALAGPAAVVDDLDTLRDLWSPAAEAWLPGGPEDPDAVLVRVDVESGEYWDGPDSRVATVVSMLRARLTDERPDVGDHGVVDDV